MTYSSVHAMMIQLFRRVLSWSARCRRSEHTVLSVGNPTGSRMCAVMLLLVAATGHSKQVPGSVAIHNLPSIVSRVLEYYGGGAGSLAPLNDSTSTIPVWWQLTSQRFNEKPWPVSARVFSTQQVPENATLILECWLRRTNPGEECSVVISANRALSPFQASILVERKPGREWTRFRVPFAVKTRYGAGDLAIAFSIGHGVQSVDIGPVYLYDHGRRSVEEFDDPHAYGGIDSLAPWRSEARERIERIRKADIQITVTDAGGRPVSGARVMVKQTRHAFSFGAFYPFYIHGHVDWDAARIARFQALFSNYFAIATVGGGPSWQDFSGNPQQKMRPVLDALSWLNRAGIPVIFYHNGQPGQRPTWVPVEVARHERANDAAAFSRATLTYLREKNTTLQATRIEQFTPVNEYASSPLTEAGRVGIMLDLFRETRRLHPGTTLGILEDRILSPSYPSRIDWYVRTVKTLVDSGVPLTRVGFQGHFGDNLPSIPELVPLFDRICAINPGIRLQLMEFDIKCAHRRNGESFMRDLLTLCFSHPGFAEILAWQSLEWSLIDQHGILTPWGRVFVDLTRREWWTSTEVRTARNGVATLRGFLGSYEAVVTHNGAQTRQQFTLDRKGTTVQVRMGDQRAEHGD